MVKLAEPVASEASTRVSQQRTGWTEEGGNTMRGSLQMLETWTQLLKWLGAYLSRRNTRAVEERKYQGYKTKEFFLVLQAPWTSVRSKNSSHPNPHFKGGLWGFCCCRGDERGELLHGQHWAIVTQGPIMVSSHLETPSYRQSNMKGHRGKPRPRWADMQSHTGPVGCRLSRPLLSIDPPHWQSRICTHLELQILYTTYQPTVPQVTV